MAVAGGGIRATPPQAKHRGHICCPLDQNGPHGPVWAMTENRPNLRQVLCHFPGASETYQGPTGQIGAQKDASGPGRRIRACETNQGPRDMALQEESGPVRQVTAWQDEPGIHGTNTGPARRIRTPQDKSGPCGRIRSPGRIRAPGADQGPRNGSGPRDESELRRTKQGPAR